MLKCRTREKKYLLKAISFYIMKIILADNKYLLYIQVHFG